MKFAQFKTKISDDKRLGMLKGDVIVDITEIAPDMISLIKQGSSALLAADKLTPKSAYALDAVEYLPAVDAGKVVAVGRNYYDHAVEGGNEPPKSPLLFTKFTNALAGHNAKIMLHAISGQIDFEAEMAVVIGKRASKVNEADALNYVFGYAPLNDVSARDLQALKIEGILNGEVMQSSNTKMMIFGVAYLIHYITQGITLEPGDVIATGTPEGVGVFRKPPVLLKDGDVFDVVIEKLGALRNTFVKP